MISRSRGRGADSEVIHSARIHSEYIPLTQYAPLLTNNSFCGVKMAESLQDENAKLRDENNKLKEEIEKLKKDRAFPPSGPSVNGKNRQNEDNDASADERIALIGLNLQEILKPDIIEDVMKKQNRPLAVYWGMNVPRSCHK